ncbi:MAG: hypothetical protein QHI48_09680 [Bacteroidota bacterium]|nr:hypothetical protein [Bacteroidota bacterium]
MRDLVACVLAALALAGCSDTISDVDTQLVFPEKDVSYSQHVQPFFNLRCATSGCHDDRTRAHGLSLTSYFALTERPGIVIPGNSDASLLVQRIDGRLPHPPEIPILVNDNQRKGIRTWVDEGAKNN